MTSNKILKGIAVSSLSALVAACGGGSGSDDVQTGTVSFDLTDAPVDSLREVNLTFTGIEIKPAGGQAIQFDFETPLSFDLLTLQEGNSAPLLGDTEVPAGRYNWVRLVIDEENLTVVDDIGGTFDLSIPSGSQNGLKLVSGFTVPANASADFTIDFDVRKSVVENNNGYQLKPTLRIVDNAEVGEISGSVDVATLTAANENCTPPATDEAYAGAVYVYEGSAAVVNDFVIGGENQALMAVPVKINESADGYDYTAAFLTEGTYTVAYTCELDELAADEDLTFTSTGDVIVTADETVEYNF